MCDLTSARSEWTGEMSNEDGPDTCADAYGPTADEIAIRFALRILLSRQEMLSSSQTAMATSSGEEEASGSIEVGRIRGDCGSSVSCGSDTRRFTSMRVLIVTSWLPFPPSSGVAVRDYQLARHIARRHEVTVLCRAPGEAGERADRLRHEVGDVRVVALEEEGPLARRLSQARTLASSQPYAASEARSAGDAARARRVARRRIL